MSHCVMCGVSIPDGQRSYSMCYGDPYYGRDRIMLRMMEEQERKQERERE